MGLGHALFSRRLWATYSLASLATITILRSVMNAAEINRKMLEHADWLSFYGNDREAWFTMQKLVQRVVPNARVKQETDYE